MTPVILAVRFPAKKLSKLRMAAMRLGAQVRVVEKWEYLNAVGSLTGDLGSFESFYDGEDFSGELLVFAHFSDAQLNLFLQAMQAAKLPPVALKAVLTDDNKGWNLLELHEELQKNEMTKRIAVIVSRFVTGSAQSFNQQTNVDLSNKYIVLDLSELKGKLLPVGMMIALDYVWDKIKSDRTKKKAIMIDEIWQLIGAGSNRMAAEFCLEIFKVIRGFGGAAISATQDLSDFFGLEDGRYGRAIINNSKNKIILNLEPDEAEFVRDTLKLTKTEIRSITRFERGEALICSNNSKVPVIIKASKEEQEMITTDRAELEAILKERQQEAD